MPYGFTADYGVPDAPYIKRAEREGYEPWLAAGYSTEEEWIAAQADEDDIGGDGDVYYGNETETF